MFQDIIFKIIVVPLKHFKRFLEDHQDNAAGNIEIIEMDNEKGLVATIVGYFKKDKTHN